MTALLLAIRGYLLAVRSILETEAAREGDPRRTAHLVTRNRELVKAIDREVGT